MTRPDLGSTARWSALWAVLLALATAPGAAEAQQQGGDAQADTVSGSDSAATADTLASVEYLREVFTYPTGGRPDPFRGPQVGAGTGPHFEDLSLAGLIFAPEIGSVAILKDGSTGKRHRVRDGERLGTVRVVEIRRDAVVFSVQGVAGPRREVLQATREEQEENP